MHLPPHWGRSTVLGVLDRPRDGRVAPLLPTLTQHWRSIFLWRRAIFVRASFQLFRSTFHFFLPAFHFSVRRSTFSVRRSIFSVGRSTFSVRRSIFFRRKNGTKSGMGFAGPKLVFNWISMKKWPKKTDSTFSAGRSTFSAGPARTFHFFRRTRRDHPWKRPAWYSSIAKLAFGSGRAMWSRKTCQNGRSGYCNL